MKLCNKTCRFFGVMKPHVKRHFWSRLQVCRCCASREHSSKGKPGELWEGKLYIKWRIMGNLKTFCMGKITLLARIFFRQLEFCSYSTTITRGSTELHTLKCFASQILKRSNNVHSDISSMCASSKPCPILSHLWRLLALLLCPLMQAAFLAPPGARACESRGPVRKGHSWCTSHNGFVGPTRKAFGIILS